VRKKRQRDAVASSEGTWNFAQHRRVIHQAKFAAECMSRCRAVYAVLVAHRLESGGIASELWGSAPWVENELAGQTGALELIWKGKAAQHLSRPRNEGVGEYDVIFESLRRDGLGHLCETFRANGVDDAAFRALGGEEQTAADKHLREMGVEGVGERVKILDAARRERTERAGAPPEATRGGDVGSERTGEDADAIGTGGAGSAAVPARVLVGMQRGGRATERRGGGGEHSFPILFLNSKNADPFTRRGSLFTGGRVDAVPSPSDPRRCWQISTALVPLLARRGDVRSRSRRFAPRVDARGRRGSRRGRPFRAPPRLARPGRRRWRVPRVDVAPRARR
jgi:hypothetical protein